MTCLKQHANQITAALLKDASVGGPFPCDRRIVVALDVYPEGLYVEGEAAELHRFRECPPADDLPPAHATIRRDLAHPDAAKEKLDSWSAAQISAFAFLLDS